MASSDALSLGLDDIIQMNRRGGRGGSRGVRARGGRGSANGFRTRGGGGGGIPRAQGADRWRHDLHGGSYNASRGAGQRTSGVNSTTKLLISNLDHGVTTDDIQELFEDVGAVRATHVHYDEHGRSLGTAEVIYERRVDAIAAQQKYNTLNLDGRPMDIKLVGGISNGPQSNRFSSANGNGGRNQRSGFRNNNQRGDGSQNSDRNNRTRGGKQQNGRGEKKEDVTAEGLDADLEAYRAASKQKK